MKEKYIDLLRLLLDGDKKNIDITYLKLMSTPLSISGYSAIETAHKTLKYTAIAKDYKNSQSSENKLKLETIIKELEGLKH